MADRCWPASEFVRSLISQLDEAVKNAERVRHQVESQMRRRAVYPDRRQERHWERLPEEDATASERE
jgi:hypothetical protein